MYKCKNVIYDLYVEHKYFCYSEKFVDYKKKNIWKNGVLNNLKLIMLIGVLQIYQDVYLNIIIVNVFDLMDEYDSGCSVCI